MRLVVEHLTEHRYARSVELGEHRMLFRPRDSHDLRLLSTRLEISPTADIRWMHDVFGNSIALARFGQSADVLRVKSTIRLDHFGLAGPDFPIAPYAETWPFAYPPTEMPDLSRVIERHYHDADHRVDAWARALLPRGGHVGTRDLLVAMTESVKRQFGYIKRTEPGTQTPIETLRLGGGTCRDYALFMMEAARALGFAARFVSGYLHDAGTSMQGGGETHAWVQIYLPGAGWVEFDPTNGLVGGAHLIRVAVARDPSQAVPFSGTYIGRPEDLIETRVDVRVAPEAD